MTTAGDVVKLALLDILVETDEGSIEASDYADAFKVLNNYMASLELRNIRLGYSSVSNNADEVTVPEGVIEGIAANLAIRLAPMYGVTPSPELHQKARDGAKDIRFAGQHIARTSYPSNLPVGQGQRRFNYRVSPYYSKQHAGLLSMAGNTTATELAATATPYKIEGFWNVERIEGLRGDITGRLTHTGDTDANVSITFACGATGNGTYTFRLMQNGASVASVSATLSSSTSDVALAKIITLSPGEYVEMWVEGDSTNAVTVQDAQLGVS